MFPENGMSLLSATLYALDDSGKYVSLDPRIPYGDTVANYIRWIHQEYPTHWHFITVYGDNEEVASWNFDSERNYIQLIPKPLRKVNVICYTRCSMTRTMYHTLYI